MWIDDKGYVVRCKDRNGVAIYEHRVVIEQSLGRQNNTLDNLEVLSCSKHMARHRREWTIFRGVEYQDYTLLDRLREKAAILGRPPRKREMLEPHFNTYKARYGSWKNALRKAKLI